MSETPHGPMGHVIHVDEDAYPFWKSQFSETTRREMIEDDINASESILAEMALVIVTGVLLAIGSVITIAMMKWS